MSRLKDSLVAAAVLAFGRRRAPGLRRVEGADRIVPPGSPEPRAELAVLVLLGCGAASATAFPILYGLDVHPLTQLLGLSLGLSFAFVAAALIVVGKKLIVSEELQDTYKEQNLTEQAEVVQIIEESGSRFTRGRLLKLAGAGAGGALGVALLTPAVSFGPVFDVDPFFGTPWSRGRRLVDEANRPYRASDIEQDNFYTAYPEGANKETFGAPIVVVRLPPTEFRLEPSRRAWVPDGIVAYSKICTHAGCAVALYRNPLFEPAEPDRALV